MSTPPPVDDQLSTMLVEAGYTLTEEDGRPVAQAPGRAAIGLKGSRWFLQRDADHGGDLAALRTYLAARGLDDDEPIVVLDEPVPAVPADDAALLARVVAYYTATLPHTPHALQYLAGQGLADPALLARFSIGYADKRLSAALGSESGLRERLYRLGVLRTTGHQTLLGCITVPVIGADGTIVDVRGLRLRVRDGEDAETEIGLRDRPMGLWNRPALAADRLLLTNSLVDALACAAADLPVTVAPQGVPTADLLEALRDRRPTVVLIHARSDAGELAARTTAAALAPVCAELRRARFPKALSVAQYALRNPPASAALLAVIDQAEVLPLAAAPASAPPSSSAPASAAASASPEQPAAPRSSAIAGAHQPVSGPPGTDVPPTATPLPPQLPPAQPPAPRIVTEADIPAVPPVIAGEDLLLTLGDRSYRVRGLGRNQSLGTLRVNLRGAVGEAAHLDSLDLASARHRAAFINAAAEELDLPPEVVKRDLGRLVIACEQHLAGLLASSIAPAPQPVRLTEAEEQEARALLTSPDLAARITADLRATGFVGEELNALAAYVAATSRKLPDPLAVVVQSSSAAGKSSLMNAVLACMPPEDVVQFSAMTGQSLYYMAENGLKNRVLAIAEDVGAERVAYALKLLQSEGELRIASTAKDSTGRLSTQTYAVAGPTTVMLTTTAVDLDEELLNRCLVLTVDEDRAQTRAVHAIQRQRATLAGLAARQERAQVLARHRNAQRLLRPLLVLNPYAPALTFPDERTRTRRDHAKYLALIHAVTLLHQYQRPQRIIVHQGQPLACVEVTLADLALAHRLAHHCLGRSLDDLPPQTRRLLTALTGYITEQCQARVLTRAEVRVGRRELRQALGWGDTALKVHLARLVDQEYLAVHRDDDHPGYRYELLHDGGGGDGRSHLPGLVDVEVLRHQEASGAFLPQRGEHGGSTVGDGQAPVGAESRGGQAAESAGSGGSATGSMPAPPPEAGSARPGSDQPPHTLTTAAAEVRP